MLTKIYVIIAIALILLIINICLSLSIKNDYYEENYLSQYFKLKNMPTFIPFDIEESNYEYNYLEGGFFYQNIDEDIFPNLFKDIVNKYNSSNKGLNYCFSLLNEFIYCVSNQNERNYKCQKLFEEKIEDLERCESINFNNSTKRKKNKVNSIAYWNLPIDQMNNNNQYEFKTGKKINNINKIYNNIYNKSEEKNENNIQNKLALTEENKEKENINYSNMDCIEYGLIGEQIICTKYE